MPINDLTEDEAIFILTAYEQEPDKKFFIHRSRSGQYRWFAWPACTAFINRDKQIDSTILFDNFIQRIEETQEWPYLTFFHLGEKFNMGGADFVARDGVAYLVSGLFNESKLAQSAIQGLIADKERYWGTSIRYYPIGKPTSFKHKKEKILVYEDGQHIEVSILPEKVACSIFTAIPVSQAKE